MTKIANLEKEDRTKIQDELETLASSMGMDSWNAYGNRNRNPLEELIGLCYNCKLLNYCKTEFGNVYALCSEFKIRLNGQNRITECNCHDAIGVMTLNEMYNIAYLIDVNKKKIAGFTG